MKIKIKMTDVCEVAVRTMKYWEKDLLSRYPNVRYISPQLDENEGEQFIQLLL